jgi:glucose-1-phosphate cytidylyltransferase
VFELYLRVEYNRNINIKIGNYMKVIILAGGWGSRLGQLSESVPKPMVAIGNKPVLWHIMKIYSHYGFNNFIIALGVKGNVIKDYFYNFNSRNSDFSVDLSTGDITYHKKHNKSNWNVTLVDTGLNTLKGGRIKRLENYLTDDINLITYGDGVADINIIKLVKYHKSHGKTITVTGVHPPARFGELVEKEGHIISFEEKPQVSVGLINGGFMVFNKNLLDYLNFDRSCDLERGALEKLSSTGEVMVYKHDGLWECMDHERDVVHLNNLWDENKAFWKIW